jgi:hypothetical protein
MCRRCDLFQLCWYSVEVEVEVEGRKSRRAALPSAPFLPSVAAHLSKEERKELQAGRRRWLKERAWTLEQVSSLPSLIEIRIRVNDD